MEPKQQTFPNKGQRFQFVFMCCLFRLFANLWTSLLNIKITWKTNLYFILYLFKSTKQMYLFVWILGDNLPPPGDLLVPFAAIVQVCQQIQHAMEREPKKQWMKLGKKEENL